MWSSSLIHLHLSSFIPSTDRYLIEHNSDVAAVNNDGELPIDIAETEAMEELLERETTLRGESSLSLDSIGMLISSSSFF